MPASSRVSAGTCLWATPDERLAFVSHDPVPVSALDPLIETLLKRTSDGLIPAVVQQHDTGAVLMLGWMDDEALHRTLTSGRVWYWSRSRKEYWRKGDTSGHTQDVVFVRLDCDGDALLIGVNQHGPACHSGLDSCFDTRELLATPGGQA